MNQLAALNRAGHERLVKRRDEPGYMNAYQTVRDHCNLLEIVCMYHMPTEVTVIVANWIYCV